MSRRTEQSGHHSMELCFGILRIKIGNNLFAHSRTSWAAFFARHFLANRFDFYAGGCVARVYIVRAMFKIY